VLPQRSLSARATREDAPHVFMSEQGVAVRHVLRSQRPESTPRALCPGTCFLAFFCFQSGLQECEAPTWSGSLDRLGRPVAASRGGLSATSAARQARGVNSTALESRRFVTPEFPFAFQRWCRELATPHPARNISDQYQQVFETVKFCVERRRGCRVVKSGVKASSPEPGQGAVKGVTGDATQRGPAKRGTATPRTGWPKGKGSQAG
jgi:hypothetical protein